MKESSAAIEVKQLKIKHIEDGREQLVLEDKPVSSTLGSYHIPDVPPLANDEERRWAKLGAIKRQVHGIQHVSRVAQLVPALFNIFRRFRDPAFENCTQEEVQATQILALIHDAARKNEELDLTDPESALLAYLYMRLDLKMDHEKAKFYAECAANKDSENHFYELNIPEPNNLDKLTELLHKLIQRNYLHDKAGKHDFHPCDIKFEDPIEKHASVFFQRVYRHRYAHDYQAHPVNQYISSSDDDRKDEDEEDKEANKEFDPNSLWKKAGARPRNKIQIALHDADCLDILRARNNFEASYLDFYKRILEKYKYKNPKLYHKALNEFGRLLNEHKGVIVAHGDWRKANILKAKLRLERVGSYPAMEKILHQKQYQAYPFFYNQGKLLSPSELDKEFLKELPFDPQKELDELNLAGGFIHNKVLIRAIANPSAERSIEPHDEFKSPFYDETKRAMTLAEHELARCYTEQGNPFRSTSLGGPPFACAGYLIAMKNEDDENAIQSIDQVDADTDRGGKENLNKGATYLTKSEREAKIQSLDMKQKLGGTARSWGDGFPAPHNEVQVHIRRFDAVFYSFDPALANCNNNGHPYPYHPLAAVLQAVYLQKTHEKMPPPFGKKLPIFKISGFKKIVKQKEFSDEKIIKMWVRMCTSFMKKALEKGDLNIAQMPLDGIKTLAMYGTYGNRYARCNGPADSCYDTELREKLNQALEHKRKELVAEQQKKILIELKNPKVSILDKKLFVTLFQYPELVKQPEVAEKINASWNSPEYKRTLENFKYFSFMGEGILGKLNETSLSLEQYKNHPDHKFDYYNKEVGNRYYELALLVNNKEIIEQNRKLVKAEIIAYLDKNKNLSHALEGIVSVSVSYGCYEAIKPRLIKEAKANFLELQKQLKENKKLYDYRLLISDLNALKKFDPDLYPVEMQRLVLQDALDFQQNFLLKDQSACLGVSELDEYFNFIKDTDLTFEQCQDFVIRYLKNYQGTIYDTRHLYLLGPYLNNREIFELVIQKLHVYDRAIESDTKDYLYKSYCQEYFKAMRDGLPDNKFKDWQIAIIEQQKDKMAKYYVAKQLQDLPDFNLDLGQAGKMVSYLYLAKEAKLAESEILPVVLKWLKNAKAPFRDKEYLKQLIAQIKPYLHHKDIFEALIKNIAVYNEKGELDFDTYHERIETVRAGLPEGKFSELQQSILTNRLSAYKQEVEKQLEQQNWRGYVRLIKFLKEMQLADSETLNTLGQRVVQCGEKCAEKGTKIPLIDYLHLAQEAKIQSSQQKEIIKQHFLNNEVKLTNQNQDLVVLLKENGLLQDIEIFNLIAERIVGEKIEEKTVTTVWDKYQDFLKVLNILNPKDGELSEPQQQLIAQLKAKQANTYIDQITPFLSNEIAHKFNINYHSEGNEVVPSLITPYLELANIASIPYAVQKNNLLLWLKTFTLDAKHQLFAHCYSEQLILTIRNFLTEEDVFETLIDTLPYDYKRYYSKLPLKFDFFRFYKLIEIIKAYCPDQKFNAKQQAVIDKKVAHIKQDIYNHAQAENKWDDFAMLIKQLKKLNLPHDDITKLAEAQLQLFKAEFESKEDKHNSKLVSYLRIAYELGLGLGHGRNALKKYLDKAITCSDKELIVFLSKSKWIRDYEIFDLVVQRMQPEPFNEKDILANLEQYKKYKDLFYFQPGFDYDHRKTAEQDKLMNKCQAKQASLYLEKLSMHLNGYKNKDPVSFKGFLHYMSLADYAGLTEEEKKGYVKKWLKMAKEPFRNDDYLKELIGAIRPYLKDDKVFKLLINNLDCSGKKLELSLERFNQQLGLIKSCGSISTFTDAQKQIIDEKLAMIRYTNEKRTDSKSASFFRNKTNLQIHHRLVKDKRITKGSSLYAESYKLACAQGLGAGKRYRDFVAEKVIKVYFKKNETNLQMHRKFVRDNQIAKGSSLYTESYRLACAQGEDARKQYRDFVIRNMLKA